MSTANEQHPEVLEPSKPSSPGRLERALARPVPSFRRPERTDALLLARQTFLSGERVDMQALAAQLSVARATLYSWFNSREQLLDELLGAIAEAVFDEIESDAEGVGIERVLNIARPLMEAYSTLDPLRIFAAREPTLALKIVVAEEGATHRSVAARLRRMFGETSSRKQEQALTELIDVIVQISSNLVWVTYSVGGEPQIDRAIRVIGALIAAAQADGVLAGSQRPSHQGAS